MSYAEIEEAIFETTATGLLVVAHTRDMSHDEFAMHMNNRHEDSLGLAGNLEWRYTGIEIGYNEGVVMAWRAFHKRLHMLRVDLEHEHEGLVYDAHDD